MALQAAAARRRCCAEHGAERLQTRRNSRAKRSSETRPPLAAALSSALLRTHAPCCARRTARDQPRPVRGGEAPAAAHGAFFGAVGFLGARLAPPCEAPPPHRPRPSQPRASASGPTLRGLHAAHLLAAHLLAAPSAAAPAAAAVHSPSRHCSAATTSAMSADAATSTTRMGHAIAGRGGGRQRSARRSAAPPGSRVTEREYPTQCLHSRAPSRPSRAVGAPCTRAAGRIGRDQPRLRSRGHAWRAAGLPLGVCRLSHSRTRVRAPS